MAYSPVELRHVGFKRGLFGYQRSAVDRTIEEVVDSFEVVWRERADYADRIEQLQADLKRHRDLETLLRSTLTTAEQAAHELKDHARREAALVLEEAHAEARNAVEDADGEARAEAA